MENNDLYGIMGRFAALTESSAIPHQPAKKIKDESQTEVVLTVGGRTKGTYQNRRDASVAAEKAKRENPHATVSIRPYVNESTTLDEKAPPGMEAEVRKIKKEYPEDPSKAFPIAWSIYNKKHKKVSENRKVCEGCSAVGCKKSLDESMDRLSTLLQEAADNLSPKTALEHILHTFRHEVEQFKQGGELDTHLENALQAFYADDIPYGVRKAKGDELCHWIADRFEQDCGMNLDEAVGDVISPQAYQSGDQVFWRGKAGHVNRCQGTKCFVELQNGEMDVWPTDEVSRQKQSFGSQLKKDAGDIGRGIKNFMTTAESTELDELAKLAGLQPMKESADAFGYEGTTSPYEVEENLSVNTSYNSRDGNQTVSVTANGAKADELLAMLKNAGLTGDLQGADGMDGTEGTEGTDDYDYSESDGDDYIETPLIVDEELANEPHEQYGTIDQILSQGTDMNRKKKQDPHTANKAANPFTETNESTILKKQFLEEYESIIKRK